jgi:hypothetical protein
MKVAVIRVIRVVVAAIVLANILYYFPPTRLFVLYAIGRAGPCPLGKTVHAFGTMSRRAEIQNRLDADKKLLEVDPAGYHLLQTAMGRYWVPARNDGVLTDNLAEQATQVYGGREDGVHRGDVAFDCGEFRVCSGRADTFEGGVRQFRECRIMSCIGAFLESRPRGTWTRWS